MSSTELRDELAKMFHDLMYAHLPPTIQRPSLHGDDARNTAACFRKADWVIANDTPVRHMAAALDLGAEAFEHYSALHTAKVPPDSKKALRNAHYGRHLRRAATGRAPNGPLPQIDA